MLELFCQVSLGAVIGLALGVAGTALASSWRLNVPSPGGAPPLPGMAAAASAIRLSAPFTPSPYLAVFAGALAVGLLVAMMVAGKASSIKPAEAWRRL
jgi:ABC-type antimicrobial peptide transport system permease subunit